MRMLNSILLGLATTAISSVALAQTDPKLTSTVTPDPIEVSLSRNVGSTDLLSPEFIARASYTVKITNGAATFLNRAAFRAQTTVVHALTDDPVVGASAPFDAAVPFITVSGEGSNCVIDALDATSLVCDFGDSQLAPGDTAEFIIVVRAPAAGQRIRLSWAFGGDEGNGGGNGCCTKLADAYTGLVDPLAADSTVKTHVQSFMVKGVLNKVFTGIGGGAATQADPWTTVADLGAGYVVNNIEQRYTKSTIDEQVNALGSCSALNKNQCWLSLVTIPDTTWPSAGVPLKITLERHSSIIKNGSKLANYVIEYSTNPGVVAFAPLSACSVAGPASGAPCVEVCAEIALTTKPSPFVWRCTIRALDNGGYKVQ